jgi:hypothetical protein
MPTTPALRLAAFPVPLAAKPAVPLRPDPAAAVTVMFGPSRLPVPASQAPNKLPSRLADDVVVTSWLPGLLGVNVEELAVTVLSGVQSIHAEPAGSRHKLGLVLVV